MKKRKVHLPRKKHHKYQSSISLRRLFFFYDSCVLKNLILFPFCNAHFFFYSLTDTYPGNTGRLRYLDDVLFLIVAVRLIIHPTVVIARCQHGRNVIVWRNIAMVHLLATWHIIFISFLSAFPSTRFRRVKFIPIHRARGPALQVRSNRWIPLIEATPVDFALAVATKANIFLSS